MNNVCHFSPDRRYRYSLEHHFAPALPLRRIMWIGLNPSTADETRLDPTLRRIRDFSASWGFTSFVMTNLFAFRATLPSDMKREADPVGPENDAVLSRLAREVEVVVACWGTHGDHLERNEAVLRLMRAANVQLQCLGLSKLGLPKHPLYLKANTQLRRLT